jgi:ribosome-associated heat shock protein Hsp15
MLIIDPDSLKFRLDKWLWAARFFKTRGLAADAIDGGKVHVDGQRAKTAKEVKIGMKIRIRRGNEELEVVVRGLSLQRRGATEAAMLYAETEESRKRREYAVATGAANHAKREHGAGRPTKRNLRDIQRFVGKHTDD